MRCVASSGRRTSDQQRSMSSVIRLARPRMASSCCSVLIPSGDNTSLSVRNLRSSVATRTMKNSSRLVATIERNLTRSSSG